MPVVKMFVVLSLLNSFVQIKLAHYAPLEKASLCYSGYLLQSSNYVVRQMVVGYSIMGYLDDFIKGVEELLMFPCDH